MTKGIGNVFISPASNQTAGTYTLDRTQEKNFSEGLIQATERGERGKVKRCLSSWRRNKHLVSETVISDYYKALAK